MTVNALERAEAKMAAFIAFVRAFCEAGNGGTGCDPLNISPSILMLVSEYGRMEKEQHHGISTSSGRCRPVAGKSLSAEKAIGVAKRNDAKVSLIHVDVNYSDLYTGLIDVNLGDMQQKISKKPILPCVNWR